MKIQYETASADTERERATRTARLALVTVGADLLRRTGMARRKSNHKLKVVVYTRMTQSTRAALRGLGADEDRSVAYMVNLACEEYVRRAAKVKATTGRAIDGSLRAAKAPPFETS